MLWQGLSDSQIYSVNFQIFSMPLVLCVHFWFLVIVILVPKTLTHFTPANRRWRLLYGPENACDNAAYEG